MLKIIYDKNGDAHSDFLVEQIILSLKDGDSITTSTENIIHAARVLSLEKGIDIEFEYNYEPVKMNEYKAIHNWPKGFADFQQNCITKLLKLQIEKRKKDDLRSTEKNKK